MAQRLRHAGPRLVTAEQCKQWYMYTDASFESEQSFGCLGGVLADESGTVCSWFSAFVDCDMCKQLGAAEKGTIIYELELLATVVATDLWYEDSSTDLHVHFGDNDGVRFSLIRACGAGEVAQSLMATTCSWKPESALGHGLHVSQQRLMSATFHQEDKHTTCWNPGLMRQ